MIENVKGKLISKTPTTAIVEVGGVSLSIAISISTFDRLPDQYKEVSLKTYLNVREDALELYGFNSIVERSLFLMLIGISGIGPKMGINILSGTTAEEFKNRIITGDVEALTALPGIGPKTAKRIIVELKEKFVDSDLTDIPGGIGGVPSEFEDAMAALTSLGFKRNEAFRTLSEMKRKGEFKGELEDIIKTAISRK
ncbi:MAG TPA: Holliday junction branch migration protein RuvA [Candidatus Marinimicrobia bacterium]|jgi:Holliday junction DNA helicase RuvA|nr:Holliday junction branch migration protein RuvA [Candidatus Neomarinimicrobiota bacterium]HIO88795.1 Holliday junction branch migration protein RuvA [Candidatus Neomarinimicrobiota bacterium]